VDGNSPYKHGSNDADWASFTFIFATPEQLGEHVKTAHMALKWMIKFRTSFNAIHKICGSSTRIPVLVISGTLMASAVSACKWLICDQHAVEFNFLAPQDINITVAPYLDNQVYDFEFIRRSVIECSQSAADCAAAIAGGRPALPVQRMIVYVHSYTFLENLVVHLKSNPQTTHIINDEFSRSYSAAMNKADRDHLIRLTLDGNVMCLTATIAASMGVDVDARIVVVIGFDGSPESMRQMAGRLTRAPSVVGRGAFYVSACSSRMLKLRDECSDIVMQSKSELAPELLAYFVELKKTRARCVHVL